jgi:NTE family protein
VRALRKRQVVDAFVACRRAGACLGTRSHVADYPLLDPMPADPVMTGKLAAIPTRLDRLDDRRQELLINWGYVICDTAVRAHVRQGAGRGTMPYPAQPLEGSLA